jgi:hypothetical protein
MLCAATVPWAGLAQAPAPAPPRAGEAPAAPYAGTVSGSVRQLNLSRGTITVQAGQGTVTFNADPGQLQPLAAGDRVAFPYVSYDGALWLSPEATRGEIGKAAAQGQAKLTGTIRRLQRAQGTITVRGLTFRVHPSRLEGLSPGQRVTLTYGQVGPTSWVSELQSLGWRAPAPPESRPADPVPVPEDRSLPPTSSAPAETEEAPAQGTGAVQERER